MNTVHLLEASMLICFGFSWPLNVMKAYRARTARGMSLPFILLIITGYIAGIFAKLLLGQLNYVTGVYFLNLAIVLVNLGVYMRNRALDKKAVPSAGFSLQQNNTKTVINKEDTMNMTMTNYTDSFDEIINPRPVHSGMEKHAVVLLGGASDAGLPVKAIAEEYDFGIAVCNKSSASVSLLSAVDYIAKEISPLEPDGVMIHLGENDVSLFAKDASSFDGAYLNVISKLRSLNKKCRIALISIRNLSGDSRIDAMNMHIKALAQSSGVDFANIENASLWNPDATKAAIAFAHDMGLSVKKPLTDIAEIIYGYAVRNLHKEIA